MRRHVILAAAMGAMLVAAAPAEVAETADAAVTTIDDDGTGPGSPDPTRDDCLRGGWMAEEYDFRNQGECLRLANESRRLSRP